MAKEREVVTVLRGRYGFNAEVLGNMTIKEAIKAFANIPEAVVKDAHGEAVKLKKAADKKAK